MWKKLKAALGIATVWGAAWAVWGALFGAATLLASGVSLPAWMVVGLSSLRMGALGFVGGSLFSVLLSSRFSARTLGELRAGRLGGWGAVLGLAVPLVVTVGVLAALGVGLTVPFLLQTAVLFGVPGFATAYATIKVAQSADSLPAGRGRGLLEAQE